MLIIVSFILLSKRKINCSQLNKKSKKMITSSLNVKSIVCNYTITRDEMMVCDVIVRDGARLTGSNFVKTVGAFRIA